MAHLLVFASGNGSSRTFPVVEECVTIGRHVKNAIVLGDESVSIYHAEVVLKNGKVVLRDLDSSNGTKVNRKRITEASLNEGDEIRFGPVVCHFKSAKKNGRNAMGAKAPDLEKAKPKAAKQPAGKSSESKSKTQSAVAEKVSAKKAPEPKPGLSQAAATKAPKKMAADSDGAAQAGKGVSSQPETSWQRRLLMRLTESRYFMLSVLIHSVIVILAGSMVLLRTVLDSTDFVSGGGDGLLVDPAQAFPENDPTSESVPALKIVQPAPTSKAPDLNLIKTAAPNSSFKVSMPQVDVKLLQDAGILTKNLASARSFSANLPGTMSGRTGSGRSRAMAQNGMKAKSEQAVMRGLIWLQQNQNKDGSWGDDNKGAMTGFGLLCFLGHGELQDSPAFGSTVGRALTWIFENGNANDGRLNMAQQFSAHGVYEHAICTYALGEYYTMTKDRRVASLLTKAIGHIIEGQGSGGGWMYSYDQSADDLSVSGWQIQALKAAYLSQLPIPEVQKSLTKAAAYLERIKGPKGGYGYRGPADDYSLTGVGILCQLFWKGERGDLRKSMEWLLQETERNKPVKYLGLSADLYAWYYHTQACLLFGGDAWKKWNDWFQDEICDAQQADGSWPRTGGNAIGPQNENSLTGATYRTSLCVLMLEVFYRYMPTTRI